MSIIKTFVDAFKKASTAKTPDALEHARSDGHLGPTTGDAAGSFEPLRPAPGVPPGGSVVPGAEDIKTTGDEMKGLSVAEDPDAGGEYKVEGLTVVPIDDGGEVVGTKNIAAPTTSDGRPPTDTGNWPLDDGGEVVELRRPPTGFKVDDLSVVEDPDAGGEIAGRKADIDSAFMRRLRFSPDTEPSAQSSDPEEGGEVFSEVKGESSGIVEDPDAGGEVVARLRSPLEVKGESSGIVEDPDAGGEVVARLRPPLEVRGESSGIAEDLEVTPIDDGGEVVGLSRPQTLVFKHGRMTLAEDPDAGGEVVDRLRSPAGFKVEGGGIVEDPDAGGEVVDRLRPPGYIGETEKDLKSLSSEPVEGDGRPASDHFNVKIEEVAPISGNIPPAPAGVPLPYPNVDDDTALGFKFPPKVSFEGTVDSDGDDASGEVAARLRSPLEAKGESSGIVEDPDAGGEVFSEVKFKIEPAYLKFGEYKVEPEPDGDLKVEGGIKFEGARFDDTQNVAGFAPSAGPPGVPIPYPNVEGDGDDLAESLARKAGGGQQEFFKVKMEEVMVTSARPGSEPLDGDEPPDDEGSGVTDWIAKKRGKGGLGFLDVKAEEPVTSLETFDGVDGESQDKDHKGGLAFARRTEVKDAHDRFSDTQPDTPPKPPAQLIDDDDDFESSSLLDLKPEPDVKEMLPGLAGELPDDAELEFDLDDDLDDTDESEL